MRGKIIQMRFHKILFVISLLTISVPALVFSAPSSSYNSGYSSPSSYSQTRAQALSTSGTSNTFSGFINNKIISGILDPLAVLLVSAAVVVFLYGVFKFVRAEDDKGKQEGRDFIIWGIVGLFVMVSVWGLVNILQSTFSLTGSRVNVPRI